MANLNQVLHLHFETEIIFFGFIEKSKMNNLESRNPNLNGLVTYHSMPQNIHNLLTSLVSYIYKELYLTIAFVKVS